jgi:hypothetical protein
VTGDSPIQLVDDVCSVNARTLHTSFQHAVLPLRVSGGASSHSGPRTPLRVMGGDQTPVRVVGKPAGFRGPAGITIGAEMLLDK